MCFGPPASTTCTSRRAVTSSRNLPDSFAPMRKPPKHSVPPMLPVMQLLIAAAARGQSIPDIRDSLEPLALPDAANPWIFVLSVAAIVFVAIIIWMAWRARSLPGPIESAEDRAHRRLAAIECSSPRALYTELHSIFVEYLERRVVAGASRRTTPELLDLLDDTAMIQAAWRTSIQAFLASCDHAKFSPSAFNCEPSEAVAECRGLVDKLATLGTFAVVKGVRRELV
jgi:hypothetical protein